MYHISTVWFLVPRLLDIILLNLIIWQILDHLDAHIHTYLCFCRLTYLIPPPLIIIKSCPRHLLLTLIIQLEPTLRGTSPTRNHPHTNHQATPLWSMSPHTPLAVRNLAVAQSRNNGSLQRWRQRSYLIHGWGWSLIRSKRRWPQDTCTILAAGNGRQTRSLWRCSQRWGKLYGVAW